jgi:hypothetical protein
VLAEAWAEREIFLQLNGSEVLEVFATLRPWFAVHHSAFVK